MIGASMQPSHRRRYPYGPAACHLIGTLRQQGPGSEASRPETSAQGDEPPGGDDGAALRERLTGYFEGDLAGRDGAERLCEDMLRGRRGYIRTQKSTGQLLEEVPAEYGRDVRLTVDIELQRALSALLERNGAIVVLDVPSGQVLAMVSRPTYDLNEYGKLYDQLSRDEIELPLWDRTVAMRFAPGSTIKPLVALAGLTEKAITPETVFECRGYLHRPGEFECYHKLVHGSISLLAALEQSCNVFFYNVGERLGVRRLDDWLTRFGYADAPQTHLPGEARGILPNPQRARAVGDARRLAIGQGLVVTPMHVANAMATIARDGVWLSPVVVAELAERQQQRRLDLPASALETVREGMRRVVNAHSGTAYKTARLEDLEFSGKTGTAETPPLWHDANGNRRVDEGEEVYKNGDTAWFVGFATSKNPQLAFAVMLEYSQQAGGAVCAPIGKQVVQVCRQFGYLK
jgi:penicillin-binding protein 2